MSAPSDSSLVPAVGGVIAPMPQSVIERRPEREVESKTNSNELAPLSAPVKQAEPLRVDGTRLTVALDAQSGRFVYKSIRQDDGDVVWQWPSEQVLRVIQYFRQSEVDGATRASGTGVDQSV